MFSLIVASVWRKQALLLISLLPASLLISGCGGFETPVVSTTQVVLYPVTSDNQIESSDISQNANLVLQASGWIEPDPFPIRIPALSDGFVEEVLVLEGEPVRSGQKIISLIKDDARLARRFAFAELQEAESREHEIISEIAIQELALEKAHYENLQAKALLDEHNDYLKRLESLPLGSISSFDLNQSRYKADNTRFSSNALLSNLNIARERLNLLQAKLRAQGHITKMKKVMLEKAELDLNRTEIFSPINGRVLRLYAYPGKRLMQKMDSPEASTAVSIYNDENLQARIDVPLADASKLFLEQEVKINCSMFPNTNFAGRLTRISGEADLQRNTLQVKVQILNPDDRLRPEMLCRAKFFSKSETQSSPQKSQGLGLFVPISLKPANDLSVTKLWVLGTEGKKAEVREVTFGDQIINQYIIVKSGLRAGDQVILNPPKALQAGDSVTVLKNQ